MHEGFEFGWEALDGGSVSKCNDHDVEMAGANVWPKDMPDFREAALKY
jgi:hypothetical protein